VVVTSHNLQRIATQVWKLPEEQVKFIPNGVAIPDAYMQTRSLAQVSQAQFTIGTVAGLRPEKNIARLIQAFAAVRARQNARLLVVGGGPELPALQALANSLSVAEDVEFAGYLADPISRLIEFDLFALSSDTEQLPIAMLEAMACGIPVVATRVGDVAHIMPSVAQSAVAEPTDAAFTATLLGAIDHRSAWSQWAAAGKQVVADRHAMGHMQAEWQQLFDNKAPAVLTPP